MKKIIITDIETCPKYFKWSNEIIRIDTNTFTQIIDLLYGMDIQTEVIQSLRFYIGQEVEPITKEEFEAELNKAFQEILNA